MHVKYNVALNYVNKRNYCQGYICRNRELNSYIDTMDNILYIILYVGKSTVIQVSIYIYNIHYTYRYTL